jgi:hypothetical protein
MKAKEYQHKGPILLKIFSKLHSMTDMSRVSLRESMLYTMEGMNLNDDIWTTFVEPEEKAKGLEGGNDVYLDYLHVNIPWPLRGDK